MLIPTVRSRRLESRLHLIDYFATKHRGKWRGGWGWQGMSVEEGSPMPAKLQNGK